MQTLKYAGFQQWCVLALNSVWMLKGTTLGEQHIMDRM